MRAYVNEEKFNCEKLNLRLDARVWRPTVPAGRLAVDQSGWMVVGRSGWSGRVVAERYAAAAMAPNFGQHFIPHSRVFDAINRREGKIVGATL